MASDILELDGLSVCHQGSVNRWECDENDHLNVRFFAEKANEATAVFLGDGAGHPVSLSVRRQHIRFLREARLATPIVVECGLVSVDPSTVVVLNVMRHTVTRDPLAVFVTGVELDRQGADWPPMVRVPDWAGPRGITEPNADQRLPALDDAIAAGFIRIGRGRVDPAECVGGAVRAQVYIGRISDAMPNLWAAMSDPETAARMDAGRLGGAVVEYRLDVHAPLGPGDVFCLYSGIRRIGSKTQNMLHLLYNETRAELAASAEAVGLLMDLTSRRAVPISPARIRLLESLRAAGD